jgi:amidase
MLDRPTRTDVERLAELGGFRIAESEIDEYVTLSGHLLGVLDELSDEPGPVPPTPVGRHVGPAATDGEDPLNAVVRWCRVEPTGEGILSGRRIALKDSIAVAGVPMTCGSRIFEGYVPERDAIVTERILAAGGEIVAITNMDDLAFSGGGDTSAYGSTLCPFDRTRTAGGSSSGSAAALWYDGVEAALGTDQGGSIRVPGAWCGVVGLKPTHGLVPYTGIVGIDQTLDHVGPLARTVEGTALLLQAIAGPHEDDPRQRTTPATDYVGAVAAARDDLSGVRIGVLTEGFGAEVGADPTVVDAVHAAIGRVQELGAEVREVSVPEHLQAGGVAFATFIEGMTALLAGGGNGYHWPGRYAPDLALALADGLARRGDDLPPQVKVTLVLGAQLRERHRGAIYARAQNLRPRLRAGYDLALRDVDTLLLPTTPGWPHPDDRSLTISGRVQRGWAVLANTYPTDLTGHPGLTMPAAEGSGLPAGVMLIGRRFDDASLLSIARTYERRYGWLPAAGATFSD